MKYIVLILVILLSSYSQAGYNWYGTTLQDYEDYMKSEEPEAYQLFLFSKNEKYDSIIVQCEKGIQEYKHTTKEKMYQAFLATAYYHKGLKDSAYQTALNYLEEKSLGNISLEEIIYYSDFMLFYPLAADEIFQKEILDFFISNYKKRQFPRADLGIELIHLKYDDQRLRYHNLYVDMVLQDSIEKKELHDKNKMKGKETENRYLAILKKHPEYITEAEVGDAYGHQLILMHHIDNDEIREKQILPMLKRAVDRNELTPEAYVDQLGRTALLNESIKPEEYQAYTDSLCIKFNCATYKPLK